MKKISQFITALLATIIILGFVDTASAAVLELTQEQKESYHQQFATIIEEVNSKYGSNIELIPLEEFKSEDWLTPDKFQELVTDMATAEFVVSDNNSNGIVPYGTAGASKTVTKNLTKVDVDITITGSFNTGLSNGRQVFISYNSITSKSNIGTWTQTGVTPNLIDGQRTYTFYVGGSYVLNGAKDSGNVYVTFYCSSGGEVS